MNNFVRFILLSVLLSSLFSFADSQTHSNWEKLNSPVNTFLRNLYFTDSLTGWAAGASGIVIHTNDGGDTWTVQSTNITSFITDIFFINKNLGWAITVRDFFPFNTVILKTTNGGNEWITEDFFDMNAFMTTIFFLDSLNGFIGGSYIARTSNGGALWEKASIDSGMFSTRPIYKFRFYNENFGYACGGATDQAGVIWRTTNGGLNWSSQGLSPDEIFDLYIVDSLNSMALSGDPEEFYSIGYIKTTNAGETWTYEEMPFYSLSFAIDFRTATEGWSASGYRFLWTFDSGITWNEQATPIGSVIYDLQFTDNRTGYAAGEGGTLLKFIPPPLNVDEEELDLLPSEFILYQNYPNPFNHSTIINWKSSFESYVSLTVYDVLGREVSELINKELKAGNHSFEFSAASLNSGIYFYRLQAVETNPVYKRTFTSTKKMLHLK